MSFQATLEIDSKTIDLLQCFVYSEQKFDQKGKPASGVHAGYIDIFLSGNTNDSTDIMDVFGSWITEDTKTKDGKIKFLPIDAKSKLKEIEFKGAYLLKLRESFMTEEEIENVDDDRVYIVKSEKADFDSVMTLHAQTRISYIMCCHLSAGKLTIDGIDHDNKW